MMSYLSFCHNVLKIRLTLNASASGKGLATLQSTFVNEWYITCVVSPLFWTRPFNSQPGA